ncbi:hypothetical protein AB3S75_015529 [Citrus x aurantiifolia]
MAANGVNSSFQPLLPVFKGVNYHFWSLKMKTLFKSQELWDLVETGFIDSELDEPSQQLREARKRDFKALFMIQQALDDEVFPTISAATTSHEAWEFLKKEYLGDEMVISVKLQTLRRDFETFVMQEKESVQEFLTRVSGIVNHMKSYGENVSTETIMNKLIKTGLIDQL